MNQICFACILGLNHSVSSFVIDKFKSASSIITHRNLGTPSESTLTGTSGATSLAFSATIDREVDVQLAAVPSPGFEGFQARVLSASTFPSVKTHVKTAVESQGIKGHQPRMEDHIDPRGNYIHMYRHNSSSSGPQVSNEDNR